jgi:hypothetical protein
MSDIYQTTNLPTFAQIAQRFQDSPSEKHIRFSNKRDLHVHDGILLSGKTKSAATERAKKQEAGANYVKQSIAREFGPKVAEHLFSGKTTLTVADLKAMKKQLETDQVVHFLQIKHQTQQHYEQHVGNQRTVFEFIATQAKGTSEIQSFLRSNPPGTTEVTKHMKDACGDHFTEICKEVSKLVGSRGAAVMTASELEKLGPKEREAALSRSIDNLKEALTMLFGGTDPDKIKTAAKKVPQEYCDLLATALAAITKDQTHSDAEKKEMRTIVLTNFGALRVINPILVSSNQGLNETGRTAMTQLAKQIQNVCNGVSFGGKEELGGIDRLNALVEQWTPAYQTFMQLLAARGNPSVT